jgi:hypothetical protein
MTFRAQEHARAHLPNARNVRRTAKAWMARPRTVRRGPQIRVSDRQLVAILQVIELGQYEQCGLKRTFPRRCDLYFQLLARAGERDGEASRANDPSNATAATIRGHGRR